MTLADRPKLREGEASAGRTPATGTRTMRRPLAAETFRGQEGDEAGHKRRQEVADLLIMSTLDQKTPPPALADGTADLLESLVEDHLRAQAGSRSSEPATATSDVLGEAAEEGPDHVRVARGEVAASILEGVPGGGEDSTAPDNESANLLQREIETLLRSDVGAGEAVPAREAPNTQVSVTVEASAEPAASIADAGEAVHVTEEELETLVPSAKGSSSTPDAAPAMEEGRAEQDDTARQLSEAEGVLADELAQLMAEAGAPKPEAGGDSMRNATREVVQAPPEPAPVDADQGQVAVRKEISAAVPAAEIAAPPPIAAAAVGGPLPPPVVVELPEGEIEEVPPPRPTLVGRVKALMSGVALLVAQLIDMPFAWVSELDKNVLGLVAFLLLLSGFVMYGMSLLYR